MPQIHTAVSTQDIQHREDFERRQAMHTALHTAGVALGPISSFGLHNHYSFLKKNKLKQTCLKTQAK